MAAGYPITALGVVNALGFTVDTVLAALRSGTSGLRRVDGLAPQPMVLGQVESSLADLPSGLADHGSRQARLALGTFFPLADATAKAVGRWGASRVGLVLGTSTGGIAATEDALAHRRSSGSFPPGFDLHRVHGLNGAVHVLKRVAGLTGPAYAVSTACSSSAKVFGCAKRLLDAEVVDAVLVGGVDTLCQLTMRGFSSLEVVSERPCRPFSAERDGMNVGEGGALLLIERTGDAAARLLGVGETSDAHHMSAPHPEGRGAAVAMRQALAQAGLEPGAVGHVNAHGTGTVLNDRAEAQAIASVLGPGAPVVATKGYTGHLLGAAGATEVALAALALEHRFVPRSLGLLPADPELDVAVTTRLQPCPAGAVISNSLAFGGSNCSVVIGGAS